MIFSPVCFHQLYFLASGIIIMLFQVIYSALILCSTVPWVSCVIDCSLDLPSLNLSPLPPSLLALMGSPARVCASPALQTKRVLSVLYLLLIDLSCRLVTV